MAQLLAGHPDVVVSGTVQNQVRFYDRFEHIVLLSAPLHVLQQRVLGRTNNPYGRSAAEQEQNRGLRPDGRAAAEAGSHGRAGRTT